MSILCTDCHKNHAIRFFKVFHLSWDDQLLAWCWECSISLNDSILGQSIRDGSVKEFTEAEFTVLVIMEM
jgi:hypothetical protein